MIVLISIEYLEGAEGLEEREPMGEDSLIGWVILTEYHYNDDFKDYHLGDLDDDHDDDLDDYIQVVSTESEQSNGGSPTVSASTLSNVQVTFEHLDDDYDDGGGDGVGGDGVMQWWYR